MNLNFRAAFRIAAAAGRAAGTRELQFHILNRTPLGIFHDRASLWRGDRLLGVSGAVPADPRGAFAEAWRRALRAAGRRDGMARLSAADDGAAGNALREISPSLSALCLQLPGTGLNWIVERWNDGFSGEEEEALAETARIYGAFWLAIGRGRSGSRLARVGWAAVLIGIAAAMVFVRLPLRIVAPCEVVPDAPFLVATPMEGVIREVLAVPGQMVEEGQPLAEYVQDLAADELAVARRQMEAAEAELAAIRTQALSDPALRGRAAVLQARLEQERARLALAETRWRRLNVVSPVRGVVRMQDPDAWRGRPVAVGERMMWVVEPERNHVRIWLPQSDRLDFDFSRPIGVHLDALGGEFFSATLIRIGDTAQTAPSGLQAFPAEAEWADAGERGPLLGLSGTAVLYGPKVPLGWWLFRKPVTGLRKWLGL